jgi:hypothetical protein
MTGGGSVAVTIQEGGQFRVIEGRGRYNIFAGYDFWQACEALAEKMTKEVYETPSDYLVSVEREKYVEYLVNKYSFVPVKFAFLDIFAEPGEADIPAEQFPPMSMVARGRVSSPVYRYHLLHRRSATSRYPT